MIELKITGELVVYIPDDTNFKWSRVPEGWQGEIWYKDGALQIKEYDVKISPSGRTRVFYQTGVYGEPMEGEEEFPFDIPLEGKANLSMKLGRKDFIYLAAIIVSVLKDDLQLAREVAEAANQVERT